MKYETKLLQVYYIYIVIICIFNFAAPGGQFVGKLLFTDVVNVMLLILLLISFIYDIIYDMPS